MDAPLSTWNWFLPHNALWVAILKGYKIGLTYLDNQKVLKRLPRSDTIHEWYCMCSNKKTLIWVNYNNSLTWNKAIWGWFPLLTMIPVRSQWGRYNLPRLIKIASAIGMNFLNIRSSSNVRVPHNFWTKPKYPLFIDVYWLNPILSVET